MVQARRHPERELSVYRDGWVPKADREKGDKPEKKVSAKAAAKVHEPQP